MANIFGTTVQFSKQNNLVSLFAQINFGAAGAPTLVQPRSKGFCNCVQNTQLFVATTASGSPTLSVVGSFLGLYVGMALTGTGIPAGTVISSMNAGAATITMSQNATAANAGITITATGGYLLQFGSQAGVRLDAYNKFLNMSYVWDTAFNQGGAGVLALAPAAPNMFLSGIRTATRTIPQVAASGLVPASNTTDCTVTLMVGNGAGTSFVVATPQNGEIARIAFLMGNSST